MWIIPQWNNAARESRTTNMESIILKGLSRRLSGLSCNLHTWPAATEEYGLPAAAPEVSSLIYYMESLFSGRIGTA